MATLIFAFAEISRTEVPSNPFSAISSSAIFRMCICFSVNFFPIHVIFSKVNITLTNKQVFNQTMLFLMMEYFDFHHHNRATEKGIYNLSFPELPREGLFSAGIHPQEISSGNGRRREGLDGVGQEPQWLANRESGFECRGPEEKMPSETFSQQAELANDLCKP